MTVYIVRCVFTSVVRTRLGVRPIDYLAYVEGLLKEGFLKLKSVNLDGRITETWIK